MKAGRGQLAAALVQAETAVGAAVELVSDAAKLRDEKPPPGKGVSLRLALLLACVWAFSRAMWHTDPCLFGSVTACFRVCGLGSVCYAVFCSVASSCCCFDDCAHTPFPAAVGEDYVFELQRTVNMTAAVDTAAPTVRRAEQRVAEAGRTALRLHTKRLLEAGRTVYRVCRHPIISKLSVVMSRMPTLKRLGNCVTHARSLFRELVGDVVAGACCVCPGAVCAAVSVVLCFVNDLAHFCLNRFVFARAGLCLQTVCCLWIWSPAWPPRKHSLSKARRRTLLPAWHRCQPRTRARAQAGRAVSLLLELCPRRRCSPQTPSPRSPTQSPLSPPQQALMNPLRGPLRHPLRAFAGTSPSRHVRTASRWRKRCWL